MRTRTPVGYRPLVPSVHARGKTAHLSTNAETLLCKKSSLLRSTEPPVYTECLSLAMRTTAARSRLVWDCSRLRTSFAAAAAFRPSTRMSRRARSTAGCVR